MKMYKFKSKIVTKDGTVIEDYVDAEDTVDAGLELLYMHDDVLGNSNSVFIEKLSVQEETSSTLEFK